MKMLLSSPRIDHDVLDTFPQVFFITRRKLIKNFPMYFGRNWIDTPRGSFRLQFIKLSSQLFLLLITPPKFC